MNTTVKTAAVPNAAVAVPVGTTPVIAAMITTVIVPVLTAAVIASWHDRPSSSSCSHWWPGCCPKPFYARAVSTAQLSRIVALIAKTTMSADVSSPAVWNKIPGWCVRPRVASSVGRLAAGVAS